MTFIETPITDHENIDIRCLLCVTTFVTGLETYEDGESACPRCDFQKTVVIQIEGKKD